MKIPIMNIRIARIGGRGDVYVRRDDLLNVLSAMSHDDRNSAEEQEVLGKLWERLDSEIPAMIN